MICKTGAIEMSESSQQQISAFMRRYCQAFRPGNVAEIVSFFHAPLAMVQGGAPRVFASQANLQVLFADLLDALVKRDFKASALDEWSCIEVAGGVFFVSAAFTRYTHAGDILERVGATYTVTRTADDFKIAAIVTHDAEAVIKFAMQN